MNHFFNKEHERLVDSIVENFLNDSKQETFSKRHIGTSESEIKSLIEFALNSNTEKIETLSDEKSRVILINQVGLSLYLIGNAIHKNIVDKLKGHKASAKDPLTSFMDENSVFHHCIEDILGEPVDNFLDEEELRSLRENYQKSIKPKIYDSYSRFEWVTPFHYDNFSFDGEKIYFNFERYVRFWKSNAELNTVIKAFRSNNLGYNERSYWNGRCYDFYELDKILVEYRSKDHDFLKEIFTLEHVFIFNILLDCKLDLKDVSGILSNCFNSFIYTFVEKFFSEEASLKASRVVREILAEQIRRENDWKEHQRTLAQEKEKKAIEMSNKAAQAELEAIKIEMAHLVSITKAVITMSLLAVLPLPYGYYGFLRLVVSGFSVFAFIKTPVVFKAEVLHQQIFRLIFAIYGIIFNPILPVHLKKDTWIFINISFSLMSYILIRFAKKRIIS